MSLIETDDGSSTVARAGFVAASAHPAVAPRIVTDVGVLDQGRVFAEAVRQTSPMAVTDKELRRIVKVVREGTAHRRGMSGATAERLSGTARSLEAFACGPNPRGLAAEVVTAADYLDLHVGIDVGIVNAPTNLSHNLQDIRIAPDSSSRKDLVFAFDDTHFGVTIWKPNGQVKTGGAQYVADSLVKMANTPGYGKVGYVDARYVNGDGTPRVAGDAFTPAQARRLQAARVRLRGFPDLEARADHLVADIRSAGADGLDPVSRHELRQFRDDIAAAYSTRGVCGRMGGGAAIAAASAAVISLLVQLATDEEVDAKAVARSAGVGAAYGVVGVAVDAGLYLFGTRRFDLTPEAAKDFAKQGTAVGFCVIAVAGDLVSEIRAVRRGDLTVFDAIGGAAAKTALDLLPLITTPLGTSGTPIVVGAQVGGRMLIEKLRERDRSLAREIDADVLLADDIAGRLERFSAEASDVVATCRATDEVFRRAMCDPRRSHTVFDEVGVGAADVRSAT